MSRTRLDLELARRGLARSRSDARRLVGDGKVTVDGARAVKAGAQVDSRTSIAVDREGILRADATLASHHPVSRGGQKLAGALDDFSLDVAGLSVLDAGASTGGFTQVLLERGAASVVALDVGTGQLHPMLRRDDRVTPLEGTNLRNASVEKVGGPFSLIVGDLSFISLCLVAAPLASLALSGAALLLLIKPQFEVGRGNLGGGGVVRDPRTREMAVRNAVRCLDAEGIGVVAMTPAAVSGSDGNREVFALCERGTPAGPVEVPA